MTEKKQARIVGQAVVITLPDHTIGDPAASELIQEIAIDCPECGQHLVRFRGHHLRAIRDLLIDTIDKWPGLCGEHSRVVTEQLTLQAKGPTDPSVN